LVQAPCFATRAAKHGALDVARLHPDWADKLAQSKGAGPQIDTVL
jgi:hypothetical protein